MSETHSKKRKLGKAVESSANKKARREVSKKYGKLTEDCIPDEVLPIGDDVFAFASTVDFSLLNDTLKKTSENFIDFTFKRIKYGPDKEPTFKEITISREQWAEMIEKYGAIKKAVL
ncbi:hypothetical protein TNCV_4534081 [Trichonephila clavipes]|nr:hypothetical protein TNCV_4534081 [Trichonephila clavipes]